MAGENCAELLGANNQVLSQSCASVNVQEYALDIAVEKTMAPGAAAPVAGGATAFTIEVQNVGQFQIPAGAEITVTDSLPSGFTFAGLAGGSGLWVCGPAGSSNVTCTYGPTSSPLQTGWSSSLTMNAAIDVNATGGAQCASASLLPDPDGFPANNTSCITVSVGRSKPVDADGTDSRDRQAHYASPCTPYSDCRPRLELGRFPCDFIHDLRYFCRVVFLGSDVPSLATVVARRLHVERGWRFVGAGRNTGLGLVHCGPLWADLQLLF
jgi:uncharacterized repeat protein (TIGR01451 family)